LKRFEIEQRIEILKTLEGYEKQIATKKKEAEIPLSLEQENVLLSIRPSEELGRELERFKTDITNLRSPDLEDYLTKLSEIIEKDKSNYIGDEDVKSILKNLLESTIESIVINNVRSLAMDVRRANGYRFKDRGDVEYSEKEIDPQELREKLESVRERIEKVEDLNQYANIQPKSIQINMDSFFPLWFIKVLF
jgi:hypothetical protein